ncbi:MAG: hypothetical protein AB1765_03905 [Candidatus Hydrogenedentota bacterium]
MVISPFALYTTYEKLKMICWLQAPGFGLQPAVVRSLWPVACPDTSHFPLLTSYFFRYLASCLLLLLDIIIVTMFFRGAI